MFRRILVLLDGSLRAERALAVATCLARASHGTVILLCVVQAAPGYSQADGNGASLFQAAVQSELDEAQRYLTHIASADQLAGLALNAVVLQGPVLATLQNAVSSYQADLLVYSEQAEPEVLSQFLGVFAEQILRHLSVPLLLIPAHGPLPLGPAAPDAFVVVFTGTRPEPDLVQPASALLAALNGEKPGHLQFVPLHALLAPPMRTVPGRDDFDCFSPAQRLADGQNDVFILATPPTDEATSPPPAINTHLRLFVPLEQKQVSHA